MINFKTENQAKLDAPATIGEIREASEEILVMSKHLEDMLKELYLEAELKK